MKKNKIAKLVAEYTDSRSGPRQRQQLKKELLALGYDVSRLDEQLRISETILDLPTPEPGKRLDEDFHVMLSDYKRKQLAVKPHRNILPGASRPVPRLIAAVAYSLVLLFAGWYAGHRPSQQDPYAQQFVSMQTEIQEMKQMMVLTLLRHSSPVEKVEGIQQVSTLDSVDVSIIHALRLTLNNDPNVNVRLMTIQALAKFTYIPEVRECLVHAISTQREPAVLLLLADVMVSMHEKEAVPSLRRVLDLRELDYPVKEKIEKSILTLL